MQNKEVDNGALSEKNSVVSRISRIGEVAIGIVESPMAKPIPGQQSEGFKKVIGAGILGAGVVVSMLAIDRVTGMGVNPLNYAIALHHMTTY